MPEAAEPPASESSLYADWQKLYPRYQPGVFRRVRWLVTTLLLAFFCLLPLLRWQRVPGLPDQAVLFDLPNRKFYLFDLIIWPQDIFLLTFILIAGAMGLFFITALAGRIFCGYICFQTVWTDLFLYVEKWFEGNRKRRIKLDRAPWTAGKLVIKIGKHITWLVISLLTGGVFVFYFADAPTLAGQFFDGSAPGAAWFTLLFLTATTYTLAGFAREQVCIYMCPYARFQGAMFDEDTLIVAYHPEIGEPRESSRRKRRRAEAVHGLCIDCKECVTVCPTGIDIRDGQQYQCITCAACIDACVSVKNRVGMDQQLIRYTSLREMTGEKTRFLRMRIFVYGAIFALALLACAGYLAMRSPLDLNVIRHRKPVYVTLSDGGIRNNFTVRVLNMTPSHQDFSLTLEGLPGSTISVAAVSARDADGAPVLSVESGEVVPFNVYVRQARESLQKGPTKVTFVLRARDPTGGEDRYETVFMRP